MWDLGLNGDIEYIIARSTVSPVVAFGKGKFNGFQVFATYRNLGGDQGWQLMSRFIVNCRFPCGLAVEPDTRS